MTTDVDLAYLLANVEYHLNPFCFFSDSTPLRHPRIFMSKVSFTVSVPHEGPHIPQFSVSCNNATYLSFKGRNINNARWGNGNTAPKKGWRRLEFGVTGSRAATKFSLMVNTSVILPPMAWSTPGPAPAAAAAQGGGIATKKDIKQEKFRLKEKGEKEAPRLGLEDGKRSHDDQRCRAGSTSHPSRGERVRRSERRNRHSGHEEQQKMYIPKDYEADYEYQRSERSNRRKSYREHENERENRRGERRRNSAYDEHYFDPPYHNNRQDRNYRNSWAGGENPGEPTSGRRSSTASSEKKVLGKRIAPKYRNPERCNSKAEHEVVYEEAKEKGKEIRDGSRYGEEDSAMYRRRGSVKPVDFLYDAVPTPGFD